MPLIPRETMEVIAMPLIHWSDRHHGTQINEIDIDKRKFVELVNAMDGAHDSQLRMLFIRLLGHAERHFERENRLMRETGFPNADAHRHEHEQMLSELRYLVQRVESGLFTLGHTYIRARLPSWFQSHSETLDSDFAYYINTARQAA